MQLFRRLSLILTVLVTGYAKKLLSTFSKEMKLRYPLTNFELYILAGGESMYWRDVPQSPNNQIAVVLGGHTGNSAVRLAKKGYKVFVFEPVAEFASEIRELAKKKHVDLEVLELAAASSNGLVKVSQEGEKTFTLNHRSDLVSGHNLIAVPSVDFSDWVNALGSDIGVLEVNIEGSEYDVLDVILTRSIVSRIDRFNIQFHKVNATSERDREDLRKALARTHTQVWNFDWVWEVWVKKVDL